MSKKIAKPRYTLSMSIAASHNSSRQLSGWIAANGYKLAIGLSIISVVIGTCVGFVNRFAPIDPSKGMTLQSGVASGVSIFFGLLIGGIAAILFENLTVGSLKRLKGIPFVRGSWKARFPNYAAVCMGVFMSVLGGDQMWSLAFSDWRALVFALAISFTLIFTEIYDHEHDTAVKTSVQRSDVTAIALQEEMNEQLEQILRQQNYAMLSEPTFIASIQEHARVGLEQVIKSRYAAMLPSTSDVPQIAASVTIEPVNDDVNPSVKLLPEPSVKAAPIQDVQIKPLTVTNPINSKFVTGFLQQVNQLPESINTQDVNEHDDATVIEHVENVNGMSTTDTLDPQNESSQIHTDDIPVNVDLDEPTIEEKRAATLRLLQTIVPPPNTGDEDVNVDLPKAEPDTNPLPKLRTPKTVKRVTKKYADGLDPVLASKIVKAQTKLTSRGVNATHEAIANEAGIKSRQTVGKYLRAMAKAESEA